MKIRLWGVWILGAILNASSAWAQIYLPSVEFHDLVQRHFVIELARVLAWKQNASGAQIQKVDYDVVHDKKSRNVTWKIRWLGTNDLLIRESTVTYPESLLVKGNKFYRDIFQIVCGEDWKPQAGYKMSLLIENYWQGADHCGLSRVESLQSAFKIAPPIPHATDSEYAPKLAGLLGHTALAKMANGTTLDVTLLARAAAWLCISEALAQDSSPNSWDPLWSPILFLAGRENEAGALWENGRFDAFTSSALQAQAFRYWNLILNNPSFEKIFLFAADKENRTFAMPWLTYFSRLSDNAMTLSSLLSPLFDSASMPRLYDYAIYLNWQGEDLCGGQVFDRWPLEGLGTWVEALHQFVPTVWDYDDYYSELKMALREKNILDWSKKNYDLTTILQALKGIAPLLEKGFNESQGSLIPVATVTSRDLLNYGWETVGLQMQARHDFLKNHWSLPDQAELISKTCLNEISGMNVFFTTTNQNLNKPSLTNTWRLQAIDYMGSRLLRSTPPIWSVESPEQNLRTYVQQCWLKYSEIPRQFETLGKWKRFDDIRFYLNRSKSEGGALLRRASLDYLLYRSGDSVEEMPDFEQSINELAASTPQAIKLRGETLSRQLKGRSDFEIAQELEKLFWQQPGDALYAEIFRRYLMAHAYDSAKRFYQQLRPFVENRFYFSKQTAPARLALAIIEQDTTGMKMALQDGMCGSAGGMALAIFPSILQDDLVALQRQINEAERRYGNSPATGGMFKKLKEFIPLIPALKNPLHPAHEQALDYFKDYTYWPTLQFVMIQTYQLPLQEAVRFLGGRDTDPERKLIIYYLYKNREKFDQIYHAFAQTNQWQTMVFVMIHHMRNELLDIPEPLNQLDLKPANAKSIRQMVLDKLREQGRRV